ncbi:MAG: hypothetical protein JNM39_02560 [Bdellovibrionaceae bacterium]|nr:hypothetical protein [Pseudobdellovibrionaceae bacterium]
MKDFLKCHENKIGLATLAILGIVAFWVVSQKTTTQASHSQGEDSAFTVDTLIPAGHVLIPIELANAEPLASLVGATAVVDLYTSSLDTKQKGRKIGSRLKLVRAPKNPQLYAVLVKESQSDQVLAQPGPYFAVIQNHKREGSEITLKHKAKFEISYQR